MDLIYANSERKDLGIVRAYNFDLAFGSDENNFELKIDTDNHCCEAGCYVYVEGTEYGGIIDAVTSDTAAEEVTYTGRTWHGILNSKVLCPDSGQDYLTLNGNANTVLSTLISRMGLTSIFEASSDVSALTISSYKMERYITGYDGIRKMLKAVNGKLVMSYNGTKVILSAAPIVDYTDAGVIDSDIMSFSVKKTSRKVNHLICLGQGELKDRAVVHLYADTSGSISQTQTLTGLDEYSVVYDYSSAKTTEDLIKAGTERLTELQKQDDLSVVLDEYEDVLDIGDIVGAIDNVTGLSISVPISKKIISVQSGNLSASYETDIGKANVSTSSQGANGKDGLDGKAATISIGTVTTGAAGSDAQVTNSGTPTAAVLNFVIPRGDTGVAAGAVRYDIQQALSDTEKAQARANIGVGNGENGATFTPSVSADGTLSWTNNKGLTNPEPVNIKGEDGAFRINVTYSGGVYSADKTFDEIKAAYDAGQQPYVVVTGGTFDLVYTLAHFSVPDGTGQDFAIFERHLIGEDTLATASLTIYSYTTGSGSNIVSLTEEFNAPSGIGIQSVTQTTTSTEDGGANVITVTKTDGTSSTFTVRNGSKGSTGATGARGATGATGATGADGKSAYQYAQESGYTGTETEFAEKLAQEQLYGTTLMLTPTQVSDAVSAGIPVRVQYVDNTWGFISFTSFTIVGELNAVVSQTIVYTNGEYILVELFGKRSDNTWSFMTPTLQPSSITDTGGYFNTDTVEGALQEIGAELTGINTLLGSGEITS